MQAKNKIMTCMAIAGVLLGTYTAKADGHEYIKRMNKSTPAAVLPVSGVPAGQWMHMPKTVCAKLCDARSECGMFVVSDRGTCALFDKKSVNAVVERKGYTAFVKPFMSAKKKAAAALQEKQDIAETAKEEMVKKAVEDTKPAVEAKPMAEEMPKVEDKPKAEADVMVEDTSGDIELSLDDLMN